MAHDLSLFLSLTIERELPHLRELADDRASIPRAPAKWSPKEELGHLIDSAANNHIRFVRAAIEPEFRGLGYAQDDWVRLHGYRNLPWAALVDVWSQYNLLLAALVKNIPEDRLETPCFIGANPAATLRLVIEDYVFHMQHHLDQLLGREIVTQYPARSWRPEGRYCTATAMDCVPAPPMFIEIGKAGFGASTLVCRRSRQALPQALQIRRFGR